MTYANVTATLALLFAMSGGALAAKHYLVSSTSQLSPKVVRALRGHTGKTGKTGPAGAVGTAGKEGAAGKEGVPGTAIAFGTFEASGALSPDAGARRLSAENIDHPKAGVFCFRELSFTPNTAIVSGVAEGTVATVLVSSKFKPPCAPGDLVRVQIVLSTTGALTDEPFTIWFN